MKPLVLLEQSSYDMELSLSYATSSNFMSKAVYRSDAEPYLHEDAAEAWGRAIEFATSLGFRFRLYDAYRPQEAQELLWSHTADANFLADPAKGSPHSRGVAVDVTLLDSKGAPLDMGTDFDAFTKRSHHGAGSISSDASRHRYLLLGLMISAGWDYYRNEWWHYQLPQTRNYPLLKDGEAAPPMMK